MMERGGILGRIRAMEKRATGRVAGPVDLTQPTSEPQQLAQVIKLPLWPERRRGPRLG